MIDKSKQNTTLKVCLDDAGTHNRAILDFFFAKLGKHTFRCVDSQTEANVILIDYDFPPARARYEEEYSQWGKPALVLSISEVALDHTIWLAKPLTSRSLLDAAETLQQKISDANPVDQSEAIKKSSFVSENAELNLLAAQPLTAPQSAPVAPISASAPMPLVEKNEVIAEVQKSTIQSGSFTDIAVSPEDVTPSVATTNDELDPPELVQSPVKNDIDNVARDESQNHDELKSDERIISLCGDKQDLDANANLIDFYTDDSFFLSSLKDAIRLARQCQQGVLLNFPQARIYVLPEIHRVFCGVNIYDDEFSELIKACSVSEGGKMHILSTREIHELNEMISQQASALYDMEAFVWTATLLSSQGGLPRTLDPNKPVGLKHWPSLTRLENFPHVMPIAALWSASSMNAFDVAKSLNIHQRYVFSFYNATNSLGLIEQDPEKLITKQSAPRTKDAPRGLFSRLLKRLVGG